MGRPRLIVAGLTASVAVLGLGTTIGRASPAAPTGLGPLRAWGGTQIRSLDPLSAAVTDLSRPRSSLPRSSGSPGSSSPGLSGSAPSASGVPRRPAREEVLSNESTFTRWAYVVNPQPIYATPTATSKRVARLRWQTEDGFPEVYLLLRARWDSHGREWVELRIPTRPNGRIGWVRRGALGALQLTHAQVVVNRRRLRMYVFQRGRLRWSAPVAVGRPSTPTPAGRFWIRERFKIADRQSGYWPLRVRHQRLLDADRLARRRVVGIHGPYHQPQAIPGRVSHGCIRLHTADEAWLAGHVGLGTRVQVL